jgi:ABC-type transport system involved in multi-copper enzyme maturation permease subunit
MTSLVRMELLKLAKRPMTWIMLALLLGIIGLGTAANATGLQRADSEYRERLLRLLVLPGALAQSAQFIYTFGAIMIAILGASSIGSEYSWGTLRPMLATGVSRTRFLAAKLLALGIAAAFYVILPLILNAIMAVPIALLADSPFMAGSVAGPWPGYLAALFGRTYLLLFMPLALAFLIGAAGRSQVAGIGAALGLMIGEQVIAALLWSLGLDWANEVVKFFPFESSRVLLGHNFVPLPDMAMSIGELRAVLTLATYSAACLAVALLLFRRRDIGGTV